jgi:hypothetical protein
MKLTDSSIRRPVTTAMIVLALMLFGFIGVTRMQVDFYPDVTFPMVVVATVYPGAGPLEVESEVTDPMEEGLGTIGGLTDITSTSSENISAITLQFDWGTNLDAAASDIRDRLDMVQANLPDDVQKPFVFKFDPSMMPVLQLGMAGNIDETELADIADEVVERLQRVPGVAAVNMGGQAVRQVQVELDLREFAASGVTTDAFAMALKAQNLNFPIGTISTKDQRYLIRLIGEYDDRGARSVRPDERRGGDIHLDPAPSRCQHHRGLGRPDQGSGEDRTRPATGGRLPGLLGQRPAGPQLGQQRGDEPHPRRRPRVDGPIPLPAPVPGNHVRCLCHPGFGLLRAPRHVLVRVHAQHPLDGRPGHCRRNGGRQRRRRLREHLPPARAG